jgi:hypothetical protein
MLVTLCLFSYKSYNDTFSNRGICKRRIVNNELEKNMRGLVMA